MNSQHSKAFGKALSYLMDQKGKGAAAAIAAEVGVTQSYLKNIRSGSGVGGIQTLRKIAEALGTTYDEMIKLGGSVILCEKDPTRKPLKVIVGTSWKNETGPPPINQKYFAYVPMAESRLTQDGGDVVLSKEPGMVCAFRKDWLQKIAASADNIFLICVDGDSMAPTIADGDTVMVDTSRTRAKSGGIYAIGTGDAVIVKRLELLVEGNALVICDNRLEYPPYETRLEDIRILGEVVWCAKLFVKME